MTGQGAGRIQRRRVVDVSPDDAPPGLRDVAAAAGVSVATVSNVLNSTGRFSEKTRIRVEQAVRELGFVRNRSAVELRTRERTIIGLLVPNLANAFFAQMARGVVDRAADHGLLVVVSDSADDEEREARSLISLTEQQVDDLVVLPVRGANALLERWTPPRLAHLVFIDADAPADRCAVSADDVAGGALVLQHLAAMGARRVGYLAPPSVRITRDRFRGAQQAAAAAGVSLEWVATDAMDVQAGAVAGQRLLAEGLRFDGLATANDLMAVGLLRSLAEGGVSVPDEVLVVGYDDLERSADLPIPLTSVRQPTNELGSLALDMLLSERSAEPHDHTRRVLQPELVARASTTRRP